MLIISAILLLILGFLLLIKGADLLVDGASSLAKTLNVSEIAIGLTIVAFGTSTPELIVNVFASFNGNSDIVFGNIIGSNLFNILMILGVSGIIRVLTIQNNTVWKEIPFALIGVIILLFLQNDFFSIESKFILSRFDGIILLIFFLIFLIYVFLISKNGPECDHPVKVFPFYKTLLLIIIGFTGLILGGKLVVDNATIIAKIFLLSEKFIALTIIAIGTSLPELATSVVAAKKGRTDIAVGNIVGSNIFNIFAILGLSAVIKPVIYNPTLNIDMYVLLFVTILLLVFMFTGKTKKIDKWEACVFIFIYVVYSIYLAYRN